MNEPTVAAVDAAIKFFNLPDYRVVSTTVTADDCRRVLVESEQPPRCPSCGGIARGRLRDHLGDAMIRSGRAMSERAAGFAVSWWMVRAAVDEACLLKLPEVDALKPRMLGINELRFPSVRSVKDPDTNAWQRSATKDDKHR